MTRQVCYGTSAVYKDKRLGNRVDCRVRHKYGGPLQCGWPRILSYLGAQDEETLRPVSCGPCFSAPSVVN